MIDQVQNKINKLNLEILEDIIQQKFDRQKMVELKKLIEESEKIFNDWTVP